MKVLKNIDTHDIEYPYEGETWELPKDKPGFVSDELYVHLQQELPLSFDFEYKAEAKKPLPTFRKNKTRSLFATQQPVNKDMITSSVHPKPTFGNPDGLSNGTDTDGVEFYGEGIEVE